MVSALRAFPGNRSISGVRIKFLKKNKNKKHLEMEPSGWERNAVGGNLFSPTIVDCLLNWQINRVYHENCPRRGNCECATRGGNLICNCLLGLLLEHSAPKMADQRTQSHRILNSNLHSIIIRNHLLQYGIFRAVTTLEKIQ